MIQVADSKAAKTKKADSDDDEDDDAPALGKRKEPESSGGDNCRVFLGGLPFKASEKDVKDMFKKCGAIKSVELPMNNEGRPAGFGFLVFEKVNEYARPCASMLLDSACAECERMCA
jgi:RNA recognition motif-containing protein